MVDIQAQPVRLTIQQLPSAVFAFYIAAFRVKQSLCFYLWVADVHASHAEQFCSPNRLPDAASASPLTIPPRRRRRLHLFDPDVADRVAAMNGSSSDDRDESSSSRGGKKYYFRIGITDRFAWEQALVPKLDAKYTDAPGDDPVTGASAIKRKACILPYVEGTRVRDAQAMAQRPTEDLVPYLDAADGLVKKKPWDSCTAREIIQGIGLHYKKNAFLKQDLFESSKESVEDLNERFELKLLAAVAINDENDNEV